MRMVQNTPAPSGEPVRRKRYARRMAFKPAALEKLKPGEGLYVVDKKQKPKNPGAFPAKFMKIGRVKAKT